MTDEVKLPPPDAEAIEFCAQSCSLVYRQLGLSATVSYLLAFLRQHYPITRIVCGFRHYHEVIFVPVADTLPGGPKTTQTLKGKGYTQAQIRKLLVHDEFEPYILNEDPFPDGPHGVFRQEDFISHMRVPLFVMNETTFQMGFCSDTPNIFYEDDMERFTRLTRHLSEDMNKELELTLHGEHSLSTNRYQDSLSLLRMCDGLSQLVEDIAKVASTDYTVLLGGETGVGKDMVADAIHNSSHRRNGPMIKINCGAVSESLLESELFGHEKGSFTGAATTRMGYFEAANSGTIFLDEIGELTPRIQVELLRILDNREVMRVGSSRGIPLDIRVIAATNRDLYDMVGKGLFRADLWYRLNTFPMYIPPLRQRKMDIPLLTRMFVNTASSKLNLGAPPDIPSEQMEKLYQHDWPGNIRELRNVVERAMIKAKSGNNCMPLHFELENARKKSSPLRELSSFAQTPLPQTGKGGDCNDLPALPQEGFWPSMAEWCDRYTAHVLRKTRGKITGSDGAAAILQEHPNTIRARRNRLSQSTQEKSGFTYPAKAR